MWKILHIIIIFHSFFIEQLCFGAFFFIIVIYLSWIINVMVVVVVDERERKKQFQAEREKNSVERKEKKATNKQMHKRSKEMRKKWNWIKASFSLRLCLYLYLYILLNVCIFIQNMWANVCKLYGILCVVCSHIQHCAHWLFRGTKVFACTSEHTHINGRARTQRTKEWERWTHSRIHVENIEWLTTKIAHTTIQIWLSHTVHANVISSGDKKRGT